MSIPDKAKAAAERARDQARHGAAQGRARLMEVQARRQHSKLVRELGEACYAEHSGEGAHEPVARACAALDAHAQAHPPALAPGLHGILTDRDIVVRCIAEGRDPAQVRAGDLAQETLFWVEATAGVGEVLHQMEDHRVKHLPVIENHRLVGIITEADLARNLDEHRLAEFVEKVYATT